MVEVLAVLIPMFAFILPILIMFIIYAGVLALAIWFAISLINNQKERNRLLAEISMNMKSKQPNESKEQTDATANTYSESSVSETNGHEELSHED